MIYSLIILCLFLLCLGLYLSHNNPFAPNVITPAIWLVCFSLWVILPHNLPLPSIKFTLCATIWITLFFLSSSIPLTVSVNNTNNSHPNKLMRDIFLVMCIITYVFFIVWLIKAYSQPIFSQQSWGLKLRHIMLGEGTADGKPYGGTHIFLWQVSYLIELYYCNRKKIARVIIPAFCYLTFALLSMSKAGLINFGIMTLTVMCFKFKKFDIINRKTILSCFLILIAIFISFHFIQQARSSSNKITETLVLYALSSISAFDTLIGHSAAHFAENTCVFLYSIAYKLHLSSIEPINPLLPWISKPIVTNTYTTMYPFFVDFGYTGIIIFSCIIGLFTNFLFRKALNGSAFWIILFSYFTTMIVMQYVAEMFFTNMSSHIRFVLLLALPFIFNHKIHNEAES